MFLIERKRGRESAWRRRRLDALCVLHSASSSIGLRLPRSRGRRLNDHGKAFVPIFMCEGAARGSASRGLAPALRPAQPNKLNKECTLARVRMHTFSFHAILLTRSKCGGAILCERWPAGKTHLRTERRTCVCVYACSVHYMQM